MNRFEGAYFERSGNRVSLVLAMTGEPRQVVARERAGALEVEAGPLSAASHVALVEPARGTPLVAHALVEPSVSGGAEGHFLRARITLRTAARGWFMFRHFGVAVETETLADGAVAITVTGQPEITGRVVRVPGDPSSAAFPLVAALIVPGSTVTVRNVGLNPRRIGLIDTLLEMGADITVTNRRDEAGEPVGDVTARAGALTGIEVPAARAPSMIDEYPILAVLASFAEGTTRMRGLSELRVKESDRLAATADMLRVDGVAVEIEGDDLIVHGKGRVPGGGVVATHMDHRLAMSALVMGLASDKPVSVDDAAFIATSFPGFADMMRGLGADLS